jgi:HPt (histidine-containing phosphotransfer) domain-containing protein
VTRREGEAAGLPGAACRPDAPAGHDLLDTAQVGVLREVFSDADWHDMIDSFRAAAAAEIDRLHAALRQRAPHAVAAHTIKGLALNMGAGHLANRAGRIEAAPAQEAAGIIAGLHEDLAATISAMLAV